jgi:hypothetical protein
MWVLVHPGPGSYEMDGSLKNQSFLGRNFAKMWKNKNKIEIRKFTLSLGLLSPPIPLSVVSVKYGKFIKTQYEMLKLSISCTRFERNYSSCSGRSSENICSTCGGTREKWKTRWNWEIDGFLSFTLSFFLMYFFAGFFLILILFMTKLRVLVLSFPDFEDTSNVWKKYRQFLKKNRCIWSLELQF